MNINSSRRTRLLSSDAGGVLGVGGMWGDLAGYQA